MKNKMRVLLIDDDEAAIFLNTKLIEGVKEEVEIKNFMNPREALNFIFERSTNFYNIDSSGPIIIFMDLNMPVMNGFEFLEEIESMGDIDNNKISIVILSSSINSLDLEKARSYNIYDYLHKPLTSANVERILKQLSVN